MSKAISIEIPYGEIVLRVEVDRRNLGLVLEPQPTTPCSDVAAEVRRGLEHPIGVPPLRELAHGARRVALIADDITRLTPTHLLLPPLLEELNAAGVADDQITLIIALGTHRPMSEAECRTKYGEEVVERIAIENHDCHDIDRLVDLGVTDRGTPILINRTVWEADCVIGVGSIMPHHLCGFSGGAKIIQPGVSGAETTAATHLLGVRQRPSLLGEVENEVRAEMEEVAGQAGLTAILNVVLNEEGKTVRVVFGDQRQAFRAGVETCREVHACPFDTRADIAVSGAFPAEIEFWQSHKALYPADMAVQPGGTIIVVSPCPEGVSVMHSEMLEFTAWSPEEIDAKVREGGIEDGVAAALAIAWARVRAGRQISLVSDGISAQETEALGYVPFATVQEALEEALSRHGPDAKVHILPRAAETLPVVSPS
ncbi:MAG: nickel-dependent lactate racemase [Chloroflexota bacterium]|nr:nickel-dependent lactate racemase [Chloroflexota bacterium]